MALEIRLRCFPRAPVRRQLRELANHKRFNIGARRLFVVKVGADIADVRVSQADDLTVVTRIGENFLVTGKAGVENNFAATAGAGTRRAPVKDSPVLERENRATCERLVQLVLLKLSFGTAGVSGNGSKMVNGPIGENGFPIDDAAGHRSENARIV